MDLCKIRYKVNSIVQYRQNLEIQTKNYKKFLNCSENKK
jgi:hypothetical protein